MNSNFYELIVKAKDPEPHVAPQLLNMEVEVRPLVLDVAPPS